MKNKFRFFLCLLFSLIVTTGLYSQRAITGIVLDKEKQPLAGANVLLKGTLTGVLTDANGKFNISVPSSGGTLVVSFMGYASNEAVIGSSSYIEVSLLEEAVTLEDVVVVGFGTQKKANLTGSVASVKSESLTSIPVSNTVQALQGVVAGLNITQSGELGGALNNTPSINIRGVTTIGEGSSGSPLVLIDGLEGNLGSINPQDIDNISVLKDAASSSIYGSRAPFGVILVTTKSGKPGKIKVNFNYDQRWNSPVLMMDMTNSYEYALAINDARYNSGQTAYFSETRIQRILDYMEGRITTVSIPNPANPTYWAEMYYEGNSNYDIFETVYKDVTPSKELSLSFNGGNDNVTYYLSGNYLKQDGLLKLGGDDMQRFNFAAKINFEITDWASITYNGRFMRQIYDKPTDLTNNFNYWIAARGWPMLSLYDDNGYLWNAPNPAADLVLGGRAKTETDNNSQQIELLIEPAKGWKIFGNLNYRIMNNLYHFDHQYEYNHDVAGNPFIWTSDSRVHEDATRTNYFMPNVYTEYAKSIGNNNMKVMIGFQSEYNNTQFMSAERQGIIIPDFPSLNITTGTDYKGNVVPPTVAGYTTEWATLGYFTRLNYDYKGKYLIEGNLRYDGTSRFDRDQRWNLFPSLSMGWAVSNEDFWQSLVNYVNYFKIRGSYGELGNQNTTSLYPTYSTMPIGIANGTWIINGARPNTASSPALISSLLTWERVKTWNIGTDLNALKNRLSATFDYYVRYTSDMIGPAPELPVILGTSVPKTNNTDLKTYGFELSLGWRDKLKSGLDYFVNLSLSDSKTKILKYPNPTNNLNTYNSGEMMGDIWGYETIGIAKTQEEMDAHLATLPNGGQNAIGTNWKAGDIMYADLNGDGKISAGASTLNDHGDLKIIGNTSPRFSFGFDLGASWKGFDAKVFLQGVMKKDYSPAASNYFFWGQVGIWTSTVLQEHLDYFRDDPDHPLGLNTDSYYPRPLFNNKNKQTQSQYILNAAYVRLKNIQLGYTIPSEISKKISIQKLRVYVSAQNFVTITKMETMFDAETVDGGWGGSVYPLCKVISLGANVNF